jgi:hypothetical protein
VVAQSNNRTDHEVTHSPEFADWHRQAQLQKLDRTIRMAEIRCIPFDELLGRIERLWSDDAASEITFRASEEPLSHNQLHALAESVKRLADASEHLPSALKSSIDRAVRRLLSRMPAEIAAPLAEPWLEHKRKFRRKTAYAILRRTGITAACGPRLLAVFQRTGDQEALKLLARNPPAVAAVDAAYMASVIDDEYWRMRVVWSLLLENVEKGVSLSDVYPREFVWAAGRHKDPALLPAMRHLFDTHHDDLEFVSMYAWALGQLGARDELHRIRHVIHLEVEG